MPDSLQLYGVQHFRLLCPPLFSGICSNSCPLSQWCCSTISSSAALFSFCLQSFPASGSFLMNRLFISVGQSTGASASASVLLRNIQNWFPLELTGLISFLSKGLWRFFSSTINSSALSLLYGPTLTFVHDYWKNHSSDNTDLCQQSDVFAS